MDTIHLIGSEDVRSAGCNISSAADNFYRAASNFEGSVDSLRRCLDEHAGRIEAAVAAPLKSAESPATDSQQRLYKMPTLEECVSGCVNDDNELSTIQRDRDIVKRVYDFICRHFA